MKKCPSSPLRKQTFDGKMCNNFPYVYKSKFYAQHIIIINNTEIYIYEDKNTYMMGFHLPISPQR